MARIWSWFGENKELLTWFFFGVVILTLTGTITQTLRGVKEGLKQLLTPLGIVVFCIIAVLGIVIVSKVQVLLGW